MLDTMMLNSKELIAKILWSIMVIMVFAFGIGVGIVLGVPGWILVGGLILFAISGMLGAYIMHKLMGDMTDWDK